VAQASQSASVMFRIGRALKKDARLAMRVSRWMMVPGAMVCFTLASQRSAMALNASLASDETLSKPILSLKSWTRRSANFRSFVLRDFRNCLPPFFAKA